MRLSIFLSCIMTFGFTPKEGVSQNTLIVINSDRTISVNEVFDIIQDQTEYKFLYSLDLFESTPKVFIEKGTIKTYQLLDKSLHNSNITYQFVEDTIVLSKSPEIPKIKVVEQVKEVQMTISGVVKDKKGFPLPGVNVTVILKGGKILRGVGTDFEGKYSIIASSGEILKFSYLGYLTQEFVIHSQTRLDVILYEDTEELEEVVLTGYQRISKERVAGSYETIGAQQIQQRTSTSFIDRLNGQISGLSINPVNGNLEIRGRSTIFTSNSNPLIVIDGFPMSDQFNYETINPEDIESVTILKDASATSIWGSRAANGVVVVITKKGRKNQPLQVNFSTFIEMETKVDLDDYNWMTTSQEIDLDMEFIDKGWVNFPSLISNGYSINDLHLAYIYRDGISPDGISWSQNTFDNYIDELRQRDITKDYEKYLLRNDLRRTYNLSISGGGNHNSFFGSLSYINHLSESVGETDDRITMVLNNIFEFNDKIKFTTGLNAALRNQQLNAVSPSVGFGGATDVARNLQAYDQLVDENGQYVQNYIGWNPWISQEREQLLSSLYSFNMLEEQRNLDNKRSRLDVRANFKLDFEVIEDLILSSSFNYEHNTINGDEYRTMDLPSQRNFINDYYVEEEYQIPVGTDYTQTRSFVKGWMFRNSLTYDKKWGNHALNVFLASEYSKYESENLLNRQFGYDEQTLLYSPVNETILSGIRNFNNDRLYMGSSAFFDIDNTDNRVVSGISNIGYIYNQKYILNASLRIDQANLFGSDPDFRYKPLWSVAAGWELGKEDFMSDIDWLNRLKIRASYGVGGISSNITSPYASAISRSTYWGYPIQYFRLSQPANDQLKWEEVVTSNIGLDFVLFKSKLTGSLDLYKRISNDLLGRRQIDPTNGFTSATINYASAENKGVELVLNANIINTNNFSWDLRANFNYNENEATEFLGNPPTADGLTNGVTIQEGKPLSYYYAYNFAGLNENGEVLLHTADGSTVLWNDPNITVDDVVDIGSRVPKHYGGLSSKFKYKGFDLTVNLNYQADFWIRKSYNYASSGYGYYNNAFYQFGNLRVHEIWDQRWKQPGDEATTDVPRIFYNGINPLTGQSESTSNTSQMHRIWSLSDINYHKGDYIRVQDLIFGYDTPLQLEDKIFFKKLRFTFQVTNPFLWTVNDVDADPSALGREAYTNLTRYTFGVRATF